MRIFRVPNILHGKIIERVNRFVVKVRFDGRDILAHLTNTGRLYEILERDREALLKRINGEKLKYRLIGIKDSDDQYALIDTITQNKAFEKMIEDSVLPYFRECNIVKQNPRFNSEVFDYLLVCGDKYRVIETKSAVLRINHKALYPDCPTLRGRKQILKLIELSSQGLSTWLIFIAAIPKVDCFMPYKVGDSIVYDIIGKAFREGVNIRALSLYINSLGDIILLDNNLKLCEDWLKNV